MKSRKKRKIIAGIIIITIILGIMGYAKYNAEMERRRECYRTDLEITLEYLKLGQRLHELSLEEENIRSYANLVQSETYDEILDGLEQIIGKYKKMEDDYRVEYTEMQYHQEELDFLRKQKSETEWKFDYIRIYYDRSESIESTYELLSTSEFLNNYTTNYIIFK